MNQTERNLTCLLGSRSNIPFRWLVAAFFLCGIAQPALAQDERTSINSAIKNEVDNGRIEKTNAVGFRLTKKSFSEVASEGAYLVGFDIGLGKFLDYEIILALRPIYQTPRGDRYYHDYGSFQKNAVHGQEKRFSGGGIVRSVRVRAALGFAVGSISLRTGLNINGMSLTFIKVDGARLNLQDSYTSAWIGSRGGKEHILSGDGMPIVGVHGKYDERAVRAIGLIYPKSLPGRKRKPALQAEPPQKKIDHPIEPPPKKRGAANQEKEAPEKKIDQDTIHQSAQNRQSRHWRSWLPIIIFGSVTFALFSVMFVALGRRKRQAERRQLKRNRSPKQHDEPPPMPGRSTGITEQPLFNKGRQLASGIQMTNASIAPPLPNAAAATAHFFKARQKRSFRANRNYRVYVLPDELIFVDTGGDKADTGAMMAGLLGGLVGAMIYSAVREARNKSDCTPRLQMFTNFELEALRRIADEEPNCFRASAEEMRDAVLESPPAWELWIAGRNAAAGVFKFEHRRNGKFTLELPTEEDLGLAIAHLPEVFGTTLAVRVSFAGQRR